MKIAVKSLIFSYRHIMTGFLLIYPITVELRSKGPGRKGNPPIREKISSPIKHFLFISILAIREFQSMGKIRPVP